MWTDQMGITARSPLTALRECVTGIRTLLDGGVLDVEGKQFTAHSVQLTHSVAEEVPILTGVLGPKSLQLSGEIADGTIMSILAGPKYLESSLEHIRPGMAKSGRTHHLLPTFGLMSIGKDSRSAKDAMRPVLMRCGRSSASTSPRSARTTRSAARTGTTPSSPSSSRPAGRRSSPGTCPRRGSTR
jgi:alkanesulfonate monooxygenase SsuD/methylene tetrahydromethanopterin reductase-like flavin-dependent oxidoreductase (luciferase family)